MKALIALTLTLLVTATQQAAARSPKESWSEMRLEWSDRPSSETMVWMCDDSYYTHLNLVLPGVINHDVQAKFEQNDGCRIIGSRNVFRDGRMRTEIQLKGSCNATISVEPLRGPQNKIMVELGDAC